MEELFKDLARFGYHLAYYEPLGAWKVVDASGNLRDFISSMFAERVAEHGFAFSCGVLPDVRGLYVRFRSV